MISQSKYIVAAHPDKKEFIQVQWIFVSEIEGTLNLQLPIWRPGRYQVQNFAKNVLRVGRCQVVGGSGELKVESGKRKVVGKVASSVWELEVKKGEKVHLIWDYFAQQEDAGGSVVQEEFLYLNFINFCMYVVGCEDLPVEVTIQKNSKWDVLTALEQKNSETWVAKSYRELVDSPWMSAPKLNRFEWNVGDVEFVAGGLDPQFALNHKLKEAYQKFSAFQLEYMGNFPVKRYTFMHWICPKPYYHGVEHTKSTMLVLGPPDRDLYEDLIGVASHELFHVWNVCTIRPKELLPYSYEKEVYFPTGGIVEGITTYLGDWFLYASGVWTKEEYEVALEANKKLYLEKEAGNAQSLVQSSIDLWLDGYGPSLPGKRVSIYYKGAYVAMLLDRKIRSKFNDQKSIREIMIRMNEEFGGLKKGYTLQDFIRIAEEVYEGDLREWFEEWVC